MPKSLSPEQIWAKITVYCKYQERCHFEVQQKLKTMGVWQQQRDMFLSKLIEADYINEERFANQYVGGKFRMKHWGKVKIRYELLQKNISAYNIKKALAAIDEDSYRKSLEKLAVRKWKELSVLDTVKKQACYNYLIQKGYESELILNVLADM